MTSILKRPTCSKCLRPQRTCICHWITPVEHTSEVLILQHPLEVDNAKGSARLLHLCLPHSRIVVGEAFAEEELQVLLQAPFEQDADRKIHPLLLYPETVPETTPNIVAPFVQDHAQNNPNTQFRLVILDATWRKSRKMLYLNPLLQQLPRLALQDTPASQYLIRKAHKPDQLSSFEASCYALMQLECDSEKYRPLLAAFDGFVAQQQKYVQENAHARENQGT